MSHLVSSYFDSTFDSLAAELRQAHAHLVNRAAVALASAQKGTDRWGIAMKRLDVSLGTVRPRAVEKDTERLVEVINITATLERLTDALEWFATRPGFRDLRVLECHPSTSSAAEGNDLVLGPRVGEVSVRCEVTDVASVKAGQNGKEKKDLLNLGCQSHVPLDGVRRYVCTSSEFAGALASAARKWSSLHYRYDVVTLGTTDTCLLEVVPGHRTHAA